MIRRTRMFAAAVAVTIAGGLTAAVAPAEAAAPAAATTVTFNCSENLLSGLGLPLPSLPLGSFGLPVDLSVLNNITVPVGATLAPVTGTLGLAPVLAQLGTTLGNVLGLTSNLVAQIGSTQVPLALDALTGALQVPGLPLPGLPGNLPVSLTQGSSITFGLLSGLLGTISCVLPQASAQLANILVRTPSQISTGSTVGAGPVTYYGGSGAASAGSSTGASSTANACLQPLARAARSANVRARSARRAAPSKVAPRIVVRVAKRAHGTVVACYGTTPIARSAVRHGRAALKLPRFYPGHYRIAVRYLGGGHFRGASSKVRVTVTS